MSDNKVRNERRINGKTVYRIRKLQSLTQAAVATAAGADDKGQPVLDHTTVAHVERGRQPSIDVMCHIANGLGVDLDEITYFAAVYIAAVHERVA